MSSVLQLILNVLGKVLSLASAWELHTFCFFVKPQGTEGVGWNHSHGQSPTNNSFACHKQNLETEHNTTPYASKINDGGFYYTCAGEQSEERMTANGGLRSYGSLGYAGLKSMIYAGLDRDDPRVQKAITWIRKHYDLKSNPGMGSAGLYYYYHTFAKSLDVLGEAPFEDADGVKHDWRRELTEELAARQQPNGSWINTENSRWMEGDPTLVTSFALMALSYCGPETR